MVSGKLFGGTVAPADEDATGRPGSDVGGAGFGDNIFCEDSRGGRRDENGTASFEGRNAICSSCHRKEHINTSMQHGSRRAALVNRDNVAFCGP